MSSTRAESSAAQASRSSSVSLDSLAICTSSTGLNDSQWGSLCRLQLGHQRLDDLELVFQLVPIGAAVGVMDLHAFVDHRLLEDAQQIVRLFRRQDKIHIGHGEVPPFKVPHHQS